MVHTSSALRFPKISQWFSLHDCTWFMHPCLLWLWSHLSTMEPWDFLPWMHLVCFWPFPWTLWWYCSCKSAWSRPLVCCSVEWTCHGTLYHWWCMRLQGFETKRLLILPHHGNWWGKLEGNIKLLKSRASSKLSHKQSLPLKWELSLYIFPKCFKSSPGSHWMLQMQVYLVSLQEPWLHSIMSRNVTLFFPKHLYTVMLLPLCTIPFPQVSARESSWIWTDKNANTGSPHHPETKWPHNHILRLIHL